MLAQGQTPYELEAADRQHYMEHAEGEAKGWVCPRPQDTPTSVSKDSSKAQAAVEGHFMDTSDAKVHLEFV